MKTIQEMAAEVREVNIALGWRTGDNTFGDYVALLHSEVAEALEAYRDHRLIDATGKLREALDATGLEGQPAKPEGVGSEFADLLIRLLDTCDVFGISVFDPDARLRDVDLRALLPDAPDLLVSFGDWMAWLHRCIDRFWGAQDGKGMLRALVTAANRFGISLDAEYVRKIAFNRTREFQHGGRTLADSEVTA